jgi:hypothetical protein
MIAAVCWCGRPTDAPTVGSLRITFAAAGTTTPPHHGRHNPTRIYDHFALFWDSRTHGNHAGSAHTPAPWVQRAVDSADHTGTGVAVEHDDPVWACQDSDGGRKISEGSTTAPNLGWLIPQGTNYLYDCSRWSSLANSASGMLALNHATLFLCCNTTRSWMLLCCVTSHVITSERISFEQHSCRCRLYFEQLCWYRLVSVSDLSLTRPWRWRFSYSWLWRRVNYPEQHRHLSRRWLQFVDRIRQVVLFVPL